MDDPEQVHAVTSLSHGNAYEYNVDGNATGSRLDENLILALVLICFYQRLTVSHLLATSPP
jgi:hypothetical protein